MQTIFIRKINPSTNEPIDKKIKIDESLFEDMLRKEAEKLLQTFTNKLFSLTIGDPSVHIRCRNIHHITRLKREPALDEINTKFLDIHQSKINIKK